LLGAEVILTVQHYLGSINHTLLSLALLKNKNINVKGIIYNGEPDSYSEKAIENYSATPILGRLPFVKEFSKEIIVNLGFNLSL
jgi:dethiobiotin synthetase